MSMATKLVLIALGYALAIAGGAAAVAIHELFIPADVAQSSGGMVAFGDMVLFVFATGVLSIAPTWFLLKLCMETSPRALLTALLLIAVIGPLSWLAVAVLADARITALPQSLKELLGIFIAFGAMPRIVAGPILLVVEGAAFLLARGRAARALVAGAMLMDIVPLGLFALHMAGLTRR